MTLLTLYLAPITPGDGSEASWTVLIIYIVIALGVSFLCSVLEAVLLSTTPSYVEQLADQGKRAGRLMQRHKQDVERPISAILTLNTIAHTVGAAGAGAEAAGLFGNQFLGLISAVLTLLILVFSEIIPKTLGAVYWRKLTPPAAYVIQVLVVGLSPAVWFFEKLTVLLRTNQSEVTVTRADLEMLVRIGAKEGSLLEQENRVMRNLLRLNQVKVETIMTPRTVMTALPQALTIQEVMERYSAVPYSRIPLYKDDRDDVVGYVLRYHILQKSVLGEHHVTLESLRQPIKVIPETASVGQVLTDFVNQQEHIFLVLDEYGGTAGIVTLEDAIESLLGMEITDESDVVADLRQLAEQRFKRQYAERSTFIVPKPPAKT